MAHRDTGRMLWQDTREGAMVSRRAFLRTAGAGGATLLVGDLVSARGREAMAAATPASAPAEPLIRVDSNENPNGPAPAVLDAMRAMFSESNRYPKDTDVELREAIAKAHGVRPHEVLLGCGSGEVLRYVTEASCSPERALVTAAPTFEIPTRTATRLGVPMRDPRVDAGLRLDLDAMSAAAAGAGLVFFCNPNNPTGRVYGRADSVAFLEAVHRRAPSATVLVDEAYFEYVADPGYSTLVPLAVSDPRVIVSRTFSKVHGLAGMRVGYAIAHEKTIAALEPLRLASGVNVLAARAAVTALGLRAHVDRERAANEAARAFTVRALTGLGLTCEATHTNFVMADIHRDVATFQAECRSRGVAVGRPFPPLTTHLRLSIGTMEEMRRAVQVVGEALRAVPAGAPGR